MAFDRNALKAGLHGATQQSLEHKDEGSGFKDYVRSCSRPRFRKIPEGIIIFDIIPWVAATNDIPNYVAGRPYYVMDLFAHTNVGASGDSVVCPLEMYGRPCPICEEFTARKSAGRNWDEIKSLKPKRRTLYNIWVRDRAKQEEAKGVQIMEASHFSIENSLLAISRDPLTGELIIFSDPDNGRHICFTRKGTGATNTRYEGFQLLPRNTPIPDAILDEAVPLDTLVTVLSYDELKAKFKTGEQEQALDAPSNYNGWDEPIADKYAPPVTSVYDTSTPVSPPATPAIPTPTTPPTKRPLTATKSVNLCPYAEDGGVFGESLDKFKQCTVCSEWDDCSIEHDKLAASANNIPNDMPF